MLNNILQRFSIHEVAISNSIARRKDDWIQGSVEDKALAYRIGRGLHSSYAIYEITSTNEEKLVLYRFKLAFACRVFDSSVLESAAEGTGPEDLEAICEVETVYDADYIVEHATGEKDEFDEEALTSFGHHNVAYHVWPFFREHLHSTLAKMQIRPVMIHTLRVPESHQKLSIQQQES